MGRNDTPEVLDPARGGVVLYDRSLFPALIDQDPRAVQARFAARFAKAETIEDLFGVLKGTSSQDLVGRTVEIISVEWAPYESDDGIIPLAVCNAVDVATGEVQEFATTAASLTVFIRRAEVIGAMPFRARITEKLTRSGQKALNFEQA